MFSENKAILINKIPEIYGFYKIHFNYTGKVFGGEQDKIFSNNVGKLIMIYRIDNELLLVFLIISII